MPLPGASLHLVWVMICWAIRDVIPLKLIFRSRSKQNHSLTHSLTLYSPVVADKTVEKWVLFGNPCQLYIIVSERDKTRPYSIRCLSGDKVC